MPILLARASPNSHTALGRTKADDVEEVAVVKFEERLHQMTGRVVSQIAAEEITTSRVAGIHRRKKGCLCEPTDSVFPVIGHCCPPPLFTVNRT